MQVIGFNFTKLSAERMGNVEQCSINTNIEFTEVEKDEVKLLKDTEAVKITFTHTTNFSKTESKEDKIGEISIGGNIVLSVSKEESQNLTKSWKKKELSKEVQIPLFNLILKKCTPKSVYLADEVSLPAPVPFPKVTSKQEQN